ncbi:MAG: hypothetical protein CMD02_04420 [Flavobacteriales bacterium]|nr:hypothetical protein [Flavobacteriales bacterium]|tara:strand:- start:3310 stop:3702 length:393 start_codon:yes stop_codon:yes gene_type:complete
MIQRVQSLFLFFSSILSLVILFYAPVFINPEGDIVLIKNLQFPALFLLLSILLTIYSIFQFKNRLKQLKIVSFARVSITVSFFLLIFNRDDLFEIYYGGVLLIIPYIILLLSAYFIKKDEKLVRSADRIR